MNNKGADQPAHPRSLISTFVVHCLDCIIPVLAKSKIPKFQDYLASVPAQAGLSLTWLQTPKSGFLVMWLIFSPLSGPHNSSAADIMISERR